MSRPTVVRLAIFLATVVASWGVLSLGTTASEPELIVGETAPRTFYAEKDATVVDAAAVEALREQAREAVEPVRESDPEIEASVESSINAVFDEAEMLVIADPPLTPTTTIPDLPTTTTEPSPDEGSTTTTDPVTPAVLSGRVFLDVNQNDVFDPGVEAEFTDQGLAGVEVQILSQEDGDVSSTLTNEEGVWTAQIETEAAVITISTDGPDIPEGWVFAAENSSQLVECAGGEACEAGALWFAPNLRPVEDVATTLANRFSLPIQTTTYLAETASEDIIRGALGQPLHLPAVRRVALERMLQEFGRNIEPGELQAAKAQLRDRPPVVFHTDTLQQDLAGGEAAGEIVATFLQANYLIDEQETEQLRVDAAQAIPDNAETIDYVANEEIVREGVVLSQLDVDAITATSLIGTRVQAQGGLLAVIAVLVALIGLYLARFRPEFWSRPRMVALLGIIVLLAAASIRITGVVADSTSWYALPAVAFGFMTAVLFDSRIAVLISLSVGVLAAAGSLDAGMAVYGVLATMAPIPFVSSVSSRGAFRNAVVLSSATAAAVAAATSWFFDVGPNDAVIEVVGVSVAWSFGISVVASLVGLAALQFFESSFDITTTLSLLDLTDRNHKALQLLQEKAFGTFNHSLMVGTLADAAARAIGANSLLARAMAYYHDLGKTEHPTFFIENQFGAANPHDELDPQESAQIIRNHVTAGVALARRFKIPTDVTQGIVSHHGDGVMRYFYEKARERYGDEVDIDDFRHIGHKPRRAETAILMLADALEAACRAVFQTEEPSPDAIEKVVDRIMNEKLEDGQLSESPLTLAELTKIRKAFLDSLIGHYHQRIAYPNFPGS